MTDEEVALLPRMSKAFGALSDVGRALRCLWLFAISFLLKSAKRFVVFERACGNTCKCEQLITSSDLISTDNKIK